MSNSVRIFFGGDFCCKPSTAQVSVSEELKGILRSCDLRVCNFEFPLRPDDSFSDKANYQHDDVPAFLEDLDFNVFTLANNHMFDCGEKGFFKTRDALHGKICGAGTYEDAYQPLIEDVNGKRIAFFSLCYAAKQGVFDDFLDKSGTGCAYLYDNKVNHAIMKIKKDVDYLVVLVHDGLEYVDVPMPDTISRYRDLIEYGADAVIGTHPHCPQGWEFYHDKPIFYSLGNLFFNSKNTVQTHTNLPHWYEGLCAILSFDDEGVKAEVVNTCNKDNILLDVDKSEERTTHNTNLCAYLQDKQLYKQYMESVVYELIRKQDFLLLDASSHKKPFSKTLSIGFHRIGHALTGRKHVQDERMVTLLKNDARRKLILEVLKSYK